MPTTIKTFCNKAAFSCNAYVVSGDKGVKQLYDKGYKWLDGKE